MRRYSDWINWTRIVHQVGLITRIFQDAQPTKRKTHLHHFAVKLTCILQHSFRCAEYSHSCSKGLDPTPTASTHFIFNICACQSGLPKGASLKVQSNGVKEGQICTVKQSHYRPWQASGFQEVQAPRFKTWRWQGCQPYAPAAFTPRKYSWY
jgi:hypothetical protein